MALQIQIHQQRLMYSVFPSAIDKVKHTFYYESITEVGEVLLLVKYALHQ